MNKQELIEKLQALPDGIPVWLGIDGGEGWLPLEEVFVANTLFCELDGDEQTNYESELVEKDYIPKCGELIDENSWGRTVCRDIIVLADSGCFKEVKQSIERWVNKKEYRKKELKENKINLEQRLREIEEELKEL